MTVQQTRDYYKEVIEPINFIEDEEMAEEIIKAVLGILTSKLSEQEASEFTAELPDYLSYEILRGHQLRPTPTTAHETIGVIADQFNLDSEQAHKAIQEVIGVAKQQASGEISDVAAELSDDWREALDAA